VPVALAKPESHDAGRDVALKTARLLAATADDSVVVLSDANGEVPLRATRAGRITPAESLSAAGWDIFASGAEAIARAVRDETGVRTVFHPHCGGYVETEWELAALFDRTDPALLGLCLDTGHLSFGGCDPVDMARRYASRIWHVHFKDCEPTVAARSRAEGWDYLTAVRSGVFCELGKGQVDFATVLSVLRNTSAGTWIVVEQDVLPGLGSPAESAARNRAYLARLGV
jgi:inosose dehydratase